MFVIINFDGRQFKIKENCYFIVNSIQGDIGDKVIISKAIMFCKDGKLITGDELKTLKIECEVVENKRNKLIVFKSKPRQKSRTKNSHYQYSSRLKVLKIEE